VIRRSETIPIKHNLVSKQSSIHSTGHGEKKKKKNGRNHTEEDIGHNSKPAGQGLGEEREGEWKKYKKTKDAE
jgi:hypothetical protein